MKILMIDDTKSPTEFIKEGKIKFTQAEVTLAKTYHEGNFELVQNGPWDILLIDHYLGDREPMNNGYSILDRFSARMRRGQAVSVKKIIVITGDDLFRERMILVCEELKNLGLIEAYESQNNGKIIK